MGNSSNEPLVVARLMLQIIWNRHCDLRRKLNIVAISTSTLNVPSERYDWRLGTCGHNKNLRPRENTCESNWAWRYYKSRRLKRLIRLKWPKRPLRLQLCRNYYWYNTSHSLFNILTSYLPHYIVRRSTIVKPDRLTISDHREYSTIQWYLRYPISLLK